MVENTKPEFSLEDARHAFYNCLANNVDFAEKFVPTFWKMDEKYQSMIVQNIRQTRVPRQYPGDCRFLVNGVQLSVFPHEYLFSPAIHGEEIKYAKSWGYKGEKSLIRRVLERDDKSAGILAYCEEICEDGIMDAMEVEQVEEEVVESRMTDRAGTLLLGDVTCAVTSSKVGVENPDDEECLDMMTDGGRNLNISDVVSQAVSLVETHKTDHDVEHSTSCISTTIVEVSTDKNDTENPYFYPVHDKTIGRSVDPNNFRLCSFMNGRSLIDNHGNVGRRKLPGGDRWQYLVGNRSWILDYTDPVGSFTQMLPIIGHLNYLYKKRIRIRTLDLDHFDFTLLYLSLYEKGSGQLVKTKRKTFLVPGLASIAEENPDCYRKFFKLVTNCQLTYNQSQYLHMCPGVDGFEHAFSEYFDGEDYLVGRSLNRLGRHRGWLRARMLIGLSKEYYIPPYILDWSRKTLKTCFPKPNPPAADTKVIKNLMIKLLFDYNGSEKLGTVWPFYFDPYLINSVSRDQDRCAHTAALRRLAAEDGPTGMSNVVGTYRLDNLDSDRSKWKILPNRCMNGVSLECIDDCDNGQLPLILLVEFTSHPISGDDDCPGEMVYDHTSSLWRLAWPKKSVSNRDVVEHDNINYGLHLSYSSYDRRWYTHSLHAAQTVRWTELNKLSLLKAFDVKIWNERRKLAHLDELLEKLIDRYR